VRKAFGIFLIILGWFIAFCGFLAAIPNIIKVINEPINTAEETGYLIGTFLGACLPALVSYFIIRTGIRLTKKKKPDNYIDKIESIK